MSGGGLGERLDRLLSTYEDRQQQRTRAQVQRALDLERARREGASILREHVVPEAREAVEALERAGHRVLHQELMDRYPPALRIHFWPRPSPLELEAARRSTLEFTWGDPTPDRLCVSRWAAGLDGLREHNTARREAVDAAWVSEEIFGFVQSVLEAAE